jgi:autotransporter-associated beta strand protein
VTIDSATASIVTGNNANDTLRVGEGGAGVFNQSAGTVTAGQFVVLGENQGSSGLYNLTGGTLNVKQNNANQPQLVVGRTGTGTLNISGSSTVNVKNGAQIQLGVGTANPSNFGPNLVANAGLSTGVGTIAQTGGTVNVDTGNGTYQSQIYGGVILGVDGSGTYTLNGGTLNTPLLGRGHGTAAFNLGSAGAGVSGTLKATASTMNVTLPINLTGTGADRGTIHTNGNDLSFTGALTGAGGFKKDGAGVLNVLGTGSTYAGGTDIVTGSVVASGTSLGTGVVNVGGGATLTIQGVQSGLLGRWVNSQSTQANPGVSTGSAAMLTEFSSLANFDYFLAGKAALAVESTAARGKVSVNYLEGNANNGLGALPPAVAALTAHNNYFADLRGKFNAAVAGDYTFQTRSDDASVIWIDGQPVLDNNRAQAQTTRTGTINLTAGLHDIVIGYFEGGSGDGFTVGVTLPGQGQSFSIGNELNMSNDLLSYGSNNLAIGSLAGSGSVLLGAGTLTTGGDGTNAAFSGVISGSGSLVKIGGGVQTLSGANTYSGTTTVHGGGTLKVGAINALPVGTVLTLGEGVGNTLGTLDLNGFNQTIAGLTTAGTGTPQKVTNSALSGTATLTVNNDAATSNADYTFGGVIENGTATTALTKSGDKKLTLSGANTYTGATIVSGGQLRVTGSISTTNANGGATVSAATATLELAGAAGSATAAGLDISNSGTLLVSTLNQQVGDVAGTGTTNVQASSSLTANSIVQDTLIIGAGGSVTIREIPIAAGGAAGANAVPEPATWVLIGIGLLSLLAFRRRR